MNKNIHIIPTDKPSRFLLSKRGNLQFLKDKSSTNSNNHFIGTYQNIYITSDGKIKGGDYFWKPDCNMIFKAEYTPHKGCKKIILTTDRDLIKDGVQGIDDEFLEWFVKNSSCESAEVEKKDNWYTHTGSGKYWEDEPVRMKRLLNLGDYEYKIIIPQEEPKQETLEEVIKPIGDFIIENATALKGQDGAYYHYAEVCKLLKLQSKRMYSEEDMINFHKWAYQKNRIEESDKTTKELLKEWFEQFKKK
jgi:hypothetical protein